MAIKSGSLYLVLSEEYGAGRSVLDIAQRAIAGGIDILQMREKAKSTEELLQFGRTLSGLCRRHGVLFIVNDDPCLARDCGADGVHLGQEDLLKHPVVEVRRILGPGKIIGLSTHSPQQALEACRFRPDYIAYGPVFPTETKDYSIGTAGVRAVLQGTTCPVVFIGGINPSNLDELLGMGVKTIALIRDIMRAENVTERVRWYKNKLRAQGSEFGVKNMRVRINGKEEGLLATMTVAELISRRGLVPQRVVIEHNGEVMPRGALE